MERPDFSQLDQIETNENRFRGILAKRETMLKDPPTWEIHRDDPDIEKAAQNHAFRIINVSLPNSILKIGERITELNREKEQYIDTNADSLIQWALYFESELWRVESVVHRLQRDLNRGDTNQGTVDRRIEELMELKQRRDTDSALRAGLELVALLRHSDRTTNPDEFSDIPEIQIQPTERDADFALLPSLKGKMAIYVDSVTYEDIDLKTSVWTFARAAKRIEEAGRSTDQIQLLNDVSYIEQYSNNTDYQRIITVDDLRTIVQKIQSWVGQPVEDGTPPLSDEFKQRVELVIKNSKNYRDPTGVSEPGVSKEEQNIRFASGITRGAISTSVFRRQFSIPIDNPNSSHAHQAAINFALYDLCQLKYPTALQKNSDSWQLNKDTILAWKESAVKQLESLKNDTQTAALVAELETEITDMISAKTTRSNFKNNISFQHKIVHLIDRIIEKQAFSRAQKEHEEQQLGELEGRRIPTSADIPTLSLDSPTSPHFHKYNKTATLRHIASELEIISPENQMEEQKQMLRDIQIIKGYTTTDDFMDVFTPREIHKLVEVFQKFALKNRPDFNGIEDRILAVLAVKESEEGVKSIQLQGLVKREGDDQPNRRGMTWLNLCDSAKAAVDYLGNKLEEMDQESSRYFLKVRDPNSGNDPDFTPVYQLAAYMFGEDILGNRTLQVESNQQKTFIDNCAAINSWYDQVSSDLETLRLIPQFSQKAKAILSMIASMNTRLNGTETHGISKTYKLGAMSAIRLQLKIGHFIEELKQDLS